MKNILCRAICSLQKQYILLHHALYEALTTEDFFCRPDDLNSKLKAHQQQDGSEPDVIAAEYAVCCTDSAKMICKILRKLF